MKKVLFATTALVASAGIASAQGVELSGSAEMGIIGGDLLVSPDEIQFHTDIDVTFTMSGETDNGLTFGASIDLDESDNDGPDNGGTDPTGSRAFANTTQGGETIFISGNFGTLTMGDTDGAFDWALQDLDVIADIADANTSHAGFSGNSTMDGFDGKDGQIARYEYSFGDFAFAVSAELDDSGVDDPTFGIGGRYSGDLGGVTLGVGLGYQAASGPGFDSSAIGISLDANFDNGLRGILNYTSFDQVFIGGVQVESHMGVGVFYTMDALSVGINYGEFDLTAGGTNAGFGLAANYDLGGGAVVQFGYGSSDPAVGASSDGFSLGIAMSF